MRILLWPRCSSPWTSFCQWRLMIPVTLPSSNGERRRLRLTVTAYDFSMCRVRHYHKENPSQSTPASNPDLGRSRHGGCRYRETITAIITELCDRIRVVDFIFTAWYMMLRLPTSGFVQSNGGSGIGRPYPASSPNSQANQHNRIVNHDSNSIAHQEIVDQMLTCTVK